MWLCVYYSAADWQPERTRFYIVHNIEHSLIRITLTKYQFYFLNHEWINHYVLFCKSSIFIDKGKCVCVCVYSNWFQSRNLNYTKLLNLQNSSFVLATGIALVLGLVSIWYLYRNKNQKRLTEKVSSFFSNWMCFQFRVNKK